MFDWIISENKNQKIIQFAKADIVKKYLLTIDADIQMGTSNTKSTTECRWVVRVLKIDSNGYDLELLTLDNILVKYSNPALKDIQALNNVFKQMYNDLRFRVNRKGELQQVYNIQD